MPRLGETLVTVRVPNDQAGKPYASVIIVSTKKTSAHRIKSDFRAFLWLVWKHINLPEPTPVQLDIASYIQHGPKRCMVQAFRGVGKSYITSAFVCWTLLRNPEEKILVVSASKDRADAFSIFTQRLINDIPILQHLRPRDDQRNSKISFDVGPAEPSHSPSVKSVGISGQLTGARSTLCVVDDVEVPSNSATQLMRDKLSELVKEFDAVLTPGGRIIYLGTPQTEDSLYNRLPERGYDLRVWPAQKPSAALTEAYGGTLAPYIRELEAPVGQSVDPKRFDDDDLAERMASYGKAGFQLQFMLSTQMSDVERYPLKVRDIIFLPLDGETAPMSMTWGPYEDRMLNDIPNVAMRGDKMYGPMAISPTTGEYTGSVLAIDPSGRGADETGFAVCRMLNGYLFVPEAGGLPGGYDEDTLGMLAEIAARNKVNKVLVEANFGDGMYTSLLRPVLNKRHPVMIDEVRHSQQKERRIIDTLEPVLMRHKLVMDPRVVEQDYRSANKYEQHSRVSKMLIYQLTRLTYDKFSLRHDDRLDALAMAVGYWTDQMAVDEQRGIAEQHNEALQQELDRFLELTVGSAPNRKNWMASSLGR